jgi:hypothetical protein
MVGKKRDRYNTKKKGNHNKKKSNEKIELEGREDWYYLGTNQYY